MWGLWGSAPAEGTRWALCLRAVVVGKACGGAAQGQEGSWSLAQGKRCGGGTSLVLGKVSQSHLLGCCFGCSPSSLPVLSPFLLWLFSRGVLVALVLFPVPRCVH